MVPVFDLSSLVGHPFEQNLAGSVALWHLLHMPTMFPLRSSVPHFEQWSFGCLSFPGFAGLAFGA